MAEPGRGVKLLARLMELAVLVLLLLALAGCANVVMSDDKISIDPESGAKIGLTVGAPHVLQLESNPTTGYFWNCETDKGAARITDSEYVPDPAPKGIVGSGGNQMFTVLASEAGRSEVTCTYARGPQDVIETRTFKLSAGEEARQ